jgi:septum formation protein
MGFKFSVIKPDVEEIRQPDEAVEVYVRRNALIKLQDVVAKHALTLKDGGARTFADAKPIFLSADTVGIQNGVLLEKPTSPEDAVAMLSSLSGSSHVVMTGYSLCHQGKYVHGEVYTEVKFRPLSLNEIRSYVETGEPMDKSGSYGAQGLGRYFIKEVHGSFLNVVGLPIAEVLESARKLLL